MADIAQGMRFKIDLDAGLVQRPQREILMRNDKNANKIIIEVTRKGYMEQVNMDGVGVIGEFVRPSGTIVPLIGSASGNVATVLLNAHCYVESGHFEANIKFKMGDTLRTVLLISGNVHRDADGPVVNVEDIVPTLSDLLAQMGEMRQVTDAANVATSEANTAASNANTAANAANTAASGANAAKDAANTAASSANKAASGANAAKDAANTAASAANTAASSANAAKDAANTAASSANKAANSVNDAKNAANTAASAANSAASGANTAKDAANTAAGKANAAANRLSDVDMTVTMLPPSSDPTAEVTQTATQTAFKLGIPMSNLAYATFEVDGEMELLMHSPDGFDDISFQLNNGELEVSI